uniref:F-box domain-containing protein n=1 Tax=Globodera rostochiensis TaxID=31243 RepID=A0A914HGA9_GLORO
MSDNTSDEEQQQQMREISICGDVWLEVFAFVSPLELGQLIMALISDRFDRLVAEHFKTRKWSLGPLQIFRPIDGNGAQIVIEPPDVNGAQIDTEPPDVNGFVFEPAGERLPIPQGPLPSKVIGFKVIEISYIDGSVIEFLQRLRRLFNSSEATVGICTFEDQSRSWDIIRQKIWPLINDNICRLVLESQLDHLRQLSPTILRNCTKLRLIDARQLFVQAEDTLIGLFPEFPADDNADASSAQAVAKWLLTRREDGRPKMLRCYDSAELEGLKRSFVNASQPEQFDSGAIDISTNDRIDWLLVRCPIAREEAKWVVWEKEAIKWQGFRQWNRIAIHFKDFEDDDIDDGMLDANDEEGPSEPKK